MNLSQWAVGGRAMAATDGDIAGIDGRGEVLDHLRAPPYGKPDRRRSSFVVDGRLLLVLDERAALFVSGDRERRIGFDRNVELPEARGVGRGAGDARSHHGR